MHISDMLIYFFVEDLFRRLQLFFLYYGQKLHLQLLHYSRQFPHPGRGRDIVHVRQNTIDGCLLVGRSSFAVSLSFLTRAALEDRAQRSWSVTHPLNRLLTTSLTLSSSLLTVVISGSVLSPVLVNSSPLLFSSLLFQRHLLLPVVVQSKYCILGFASFV